MTTDSEGPPDTYDALIRWVAALWGPGGWNPQHVVIARLSDAVTFWRNSKPEKIHAPIPMLLTCPNPDCCKRHIDRGEFATKAHHTHACQECGMVWRPAVEPTVGVQHLPGFKDPAP